MQNTTLDHIAASLDRLKQGEDDARDELITLACQRLERLCRKMLNEYPRLRQWEQTGDVLQNAVLRLRHSLEHVTPNSVREFFGLAATQIRRELQDLIRHYYGRSQALSSGKEGRPAERPKRAGVMGVKPADRDGETPPVDPGDSTQDPNRLALWAEFHQRVDSLPADEREVVDLLWYQERTQEEAAELLGVDKSTVKRRWRDAKLKLSDVLQGWLK